MENLLLLQKVLLTIALTALIGLEREWRKKKEVVFGGVRSFIFIGLLGLMMGYFSEISQSFAPILLGLCFVSGLSIVSYWTALKKMVVGSTTRIAAILVFVIGVLVFYEQTPYTISLTITVIVALLLLSKETIRKSIKKLKKEEIRDALIFIIFAFIIFPLLPTKPLYGIINIKMGWAFGVVVLAIGFLVYVVIRLVGATSGLLFSGLIGGFYGSTQLTILLSHHSRKNKRAALLISSAVVVASSLMFLRQMIIALIFNMLIPQVVIPFLLISASGVFLGVRLWKINVKNKKTLNVINIKSPLTLKHALIFMVYFILVLAIVNLVTKHLGEKVIYITSAISGLADVDAITISLASSTAIGLPPIAAVNGMLIAGLVNTISKWFIVRLLGIKEMEKTIRKYMLLIAILCVAFVVLHTLMLS